MARRNKVTTINGVKHLKPWKSPYRQRVNALKIERLRAAGLLSRIIKRTMPIRAFGESELRIPMGPVPKWTKFHYNTGKHYKIAGGSMRRKAARRQQYTNYNNVESIANMRNKMLSEILNNPVDMAAHDAMKERIVNSFAPSSKKHFGVLSGDVKWIANNF